jgi:integrase
MKKALTDRALKALQPAPTGARRMIWDASLPSFGVRVTDKGRASFVVMRRLNGKLIRDVVGSFQVGSYPSEGGPLARAREAARASIALIQDGIAPKVARQARARDAERRSQDTFEAVAQEFIKRHVAKLRTATNVEQTIRRELIPRWGKRPLAEITRRDVVAMIEEVTETRPFIAFHLLAYTKKLYNWAIARDLYGIETSPADRVFAKDVIGELQSRDRVLTDSEMRAVWQAAGAELGYPFGPFVRMLLLTGQRLREVAEMTWDEIDLDKALWTIPASRMKGEQSHEVPLSAAAMELLESLPRFDGPKNGPFVFTTTSGQRPVSGFSKTKQRLDGLILEGLRKAAIEAGEISPKLKAPSRWTFHDLRRSMRTQMSALPIPSDVAELVIAHKQRGIRSTYDLHRYLPEKNRALDLWATRLKEIVEPAPASNIVRLREHAQ